MGVLIDSSVLVAAERGGIDWEALLGRSIELDEDEPVALSVVTAAELLHGVHRLKGVTRVRAERYVDGLLSRLPVHPFDMSVARVHAMLSADLASSGAAVGAHDLIIAATAVDLGYDVATRDVRSFPRIRGLRIRRW